MIGLEKSFWMIYSNTHLRTRETLPLKILSYGKMGGKWYGTNRLTILNCKVDHFPFYFENDTITRRAWNCSHCPNNFWICIDQLNAVKSENRVHCHTNFQSLCFLAYAAIHATFKISFGCHLSHHAIITLLYGDILWPYNTVVKQCGPCTVRYRGDHTNRQSGTVGTSPYSSCTVIKYSVVRGWHQFWDYTYW